MSHAEILTKAIEKALKAGWKTKWGEKLDDSHVQWRNRIIDEPELFIFNHNFAKALWGEEPYAKHYYMFEDGTHWRERDDRLPNWSWHLQQIVIADDPIKYLGENLGDLGTRDFPTAEESTTKNGGIVRKVAHT